MPRRPTPNLRDALIREAIGLVEEHGQEGLHLRELAARAGVSRQAPYLHFADRRALLAAVGAEGIRRLRSAVDAELTHVSEDPRLRVHRIAATYATFAAEHPRLREVMYGPHVAKGDSPEFQAEAAALFAQVRELVARCPRPCAELHEARRRTVVVWATVQGVVQLAADGQIPPSVGSGPDELVREGVDTVLRGWATGPGGEVT